MLVNWLNDTQCRRAHSISSVEVGNHPNSLGCSIHDVVGKSHDVYEQLRMPVGNLFWVREATSER